MGGLRPRRKIYLRYYNSARQCRSDEVNAFCTGCAVQYYSVSLFEVLCAWWELLYAYK